MRTLYTLAAYLLAPLYCAVLLWRGLRERGYWQHFAERFGRGTRLTRPAVWVHAASAGEVQACVPLIAALRGQRADVPIVLTTTTPAGAARGRALLAQQGVDVRHVPLDLPGAVRRFFVRVQPRLAIVLETEIWPNLFARCARDGVPLVLASARLSARSLPRYRLVAGLTRRTLAHCRLIAAQTRDDATRFIALGAAPARVEVLGNLKFDFDMPAGTAARGEALRARYAPERALWVAGSTHEGEEEAALAAHRQLRAAHVTALMVLAPRHPQRFADVAARLARGGTRFVRRSSGAPCEADTEVLLLDGLGELIDFYAAADVAFVGGSLVPIGGHNLLEPAALGVPVLTGPYNANGRDVLQLLLERGAARVIHDAGELGAELARLVASPEARERMAGSARAVVEENRGAAARLAGALRPLIASA